MFHNIFLVFFCIFLYQSHGSEIEPLQSNIKKDEKKNNVSLNHSDDPFMLQSFYFSENDNIAIKQSFDSHFFSMSAYFLFEEGRQGSRRVLFDNHDNVKKNGFRLSLFEISENATCIEFSYYDHKEILRHIHSSPYELRNQWNHLLCTVSMNPKKQSVSSLHIYLNMNEIVNNSILRSEKSYIEMHIGRGVDNHNSFDGRLKDFFIYAAVVTLAIDQQYRKLLSMDRSIENLQQYMQNEERLTFVFLTSSTGVSLVTPYQSTVLFLSVPMDNAIPAVEKKPIVFRLNSNITKRIENKDNPQQLNTCLVFEEPVLAKQDIHSVEDYELYLQSLPTYSLCEGNYHNTLPESIEADWRKVFDERAKLVKQSTIHFWKNYKQFAFGCDELAPISKQCKNNWGNVGMTLIDSLDTLWIMDLKEEFNEAVNYITDHIHFNTDYDMSTFEFTIRILGGLLSGYYLSQDNRLLHKAEEAGDVVYAAFTNNTAFPHAKVNLKSRTGTSVNDRVSLAEFGTLTVEFRYLSHLTHNPRYSDCIDKIYQAIMKQGTSDGLYTQLISFYHDYHVLESLMYYYAHSTSQGVNHYYSVGGCSDTFYEYLLKGYIQSHYQDTILIQQFHQSIQGILSKLVKKSKFNSMQVIGQLANKRFIHSFELLSCFLPGMLFLYNYHIFENNNITVDKQARSLLYSCFQLANCTKTGLPAEVTKISDIQGMSVIQKQKMYLLRPEIIESFYYLKELQKDPIAQEWGWLFYQALEKYCKTESGYASFSDVQDPQAKKDDIAESFFVAETLKYLYLLFSSKPIVDHKRMFLTTEAHILPIL